MTPLLLLLLPLADGLGHPPPVRQEVALDTAAVASQIDSIADEVDQLERRVARLSSELDDSADLGLVLFLFGAFCSLWARNTGRGPWLWFFLGMLFSVVAVLFLLSKNAADRRALESSDQIP